MIEIKIPIEKIAADKAASKAPEDAFLDILKRRGLPSAQKKNPEPKKPAA